MLDAFEVMGVELVKIDTHYPVFTPAFHTYLLANPPPLVPNYVYTVDNFIGYAASFYNKLADEIRARGMGLWIEHSTLFNDWSTTPPGDYFADIRAAGVAPARARYLQERAAETVLIVSELSPDYYTLVDEPTTQNDNFGYFPGGVPILTHDGWRDLVQTSAADIAAAVPGYTSLLGAGSGTWEGRGYTERFAALPELDYIDFHLYPLASTAEDFAQNLLDWSDYVRGVDPTKKLTLGESWLYKASVAEISGGLDHNVIFGRDTYSFWEPLDRQFLQMLFKIVHLKDFEAVMPFWSQYYFAYLTHGDPTLEGLSGVQLVARAGQDATPNIQSVTLTGTGEKFVELAAVDPPTFHCASDATCPEVLIAGDPHATIGGNPAPFRGYGDPSLERDPDTGTLWLSYSWLDVLISSPGPPPVFDFGVRTHLARSDDNGATFSFVRDVNQTVAIAHPDTSAQGWTIHEVSTLLREGPASWQNVWLTYFDPIGQPPPGTDHRSDFYYTRSVANSPDGLGDVATPWIRTNGTSASWGVVHNLSTIPQLADCAALTEPALFAYTGVTYLASNCAVFIGGVRRDDLERLVLLKQEPNGYSYVGELLDYADALYLGGTRLEQADLAVAQNGAILLILTPIQSAQPDHRGCVVLEVTDITAAQVRRDAAGDPLKLATITGEDSTIGPGLCTYDASSQTGVLMVLHAQTQNPPETVFSLRATGVHPNGIDTDADGTADTIDRNDDNDILGDAAEAACGSDPLLPTSTPERLDGAFATIDEDGDTAIDEALPSPGSDAFDCDGDGWTGNQEELIFAVGTTANDQDACGESGWPGELAGNNNALNIADLNSFLSPLRLDGSFNKFNHQLDEDGDTVIDPAMARWNLQTPPHVATTEINIGDLNALITGAAGSPARPAMFGGQQAFFTNGGMCPWPP